MRTNMQVYRVVGDYGIHADEYLEVFVEARSMQSALNKAEKVFKKSDRWGRMGRHNMHAFVRHNALLTS